MHVCLVGPALSQDRTLLTRLTADHLVTVATSANMLVGRPMMASVDALVLDAASVRSGLGGVVATLRERHPDLAIVLVDGELAQLELADAFHRGIDDYFAAPWSVSLLAERVEVLAARRRHAMAEPTMNGGTQ
jgi:DNA-binding response OmpR family regulator